MTVLSEDIKSGIMKLQIRKRVIRYIAVLYLVMGVLGIFKILFNPIFEEMQLANWKQILFMIPSVIYLLAGFGLIIFQKWARILAVIVTAIILGSFLLLIRYDFGGRILPFLLISGFILVFAYFIIILMHKDTKLIFDWRGNIEGLDNSH